MNPNVPLQWPVSPQTPLHKGFALKRTNVHRSGALSVITENQFWSHLSASLHPMVTKIMKKLCHKTQNAWRMVPQDLKKSINLWNKINEICLKRYMQLLNFPMISILPICIFSINRTANRETTDCWRGRRQGRSLRIEQLRFPVFPGYQESWKAEMSPFPG